MIIIQLYRVIDYENNKYIVKLYKNVYDVKPVKVNIDRWGFDKWRLEKLNKSELEGEKLQLHKLRKI